MWRAGFMSTLRADAPLFIPTCLRQPGVNGAAELTGSREALAPSRKRPLVLIIFGSRGSGKTTQSNLLAEEYNLLNISSGTLFREGKQPFVELRKILLAEFGEGKERRYNGVVLDRFVAKSKFDAFYIQSILNLVMLPVPFAFMLSIDLKLAAKRAESRGDEKKGHHYWRLVEQKAQSVTANTVYAPIGCLKTIHVTNDATKEDVFAEIKSTIETQLPETLESVTFSAAARHEAKGMKLIDVYETYMKIAADVHAAVGNVYGRRDAAPLSSIGSYMDRDYFVSGDRNLRALLSTFHVTLKADGERYLLAKHKSYGYIGFPQAFTHCYDLNELFQGLELSCNFSSETTQNSRFQRPEKSVEFLFDTELMVHDGHPTFYVLDFVYFGGLEGKKIPFEKRLQTLRDYFDEHTSAAHVVCLKNYVPISKLRTLLPRWGETKLPIDGLVFQHSKVYKIGRDECLVKWKPIDMCTADFRLANGVIEGGDWVFELMVTDDVLEDAGLGEILFDGALARLPAAVVEENRLCGGMVVEMALVEKKETAGKKRTSVATQTRWSFRGVRDDKLSPNKHSVVRKIVEMEHLDFEELLELCEKVPFCT